MASDNGNLLVISSNYRGEISVNQLPLQRNPIRCSNGIIYTLSSGVLIPKFSPKISSKLTSRKKQKLQQPNHPIRDSNTGELIQIMLRLLSRGKGSVIDGSLAGDLGFDPCGIADTKPKLKRMREIELKHARIAMLATIGWPISELYNRQMAAIFSPKVSIIVINC